MLALVLLLPPDAPADPVRDNLPYRIAFGRPQFSSGEETACYFWDQYGRVRFRITPGDRPRRVKGEMRTGGDGAFEDVSPLSQELRIHQPRPGKLLFDVEMRGEEEGFDVTLGGDFGHVTIDLFIDGERSPRALRIGGKQQRPAALPARLDLRNADSTWLERFGF